MKTNELATILESVENTVKAKLPLNQEQLDKIVNLPESEAEANGSIDQDFSVPITMGTGKVEESKSTYGVTIKGYFDIKSPDDGTWTIIAKIAGKTVVDEHDIVKGDKINFTAKTDFWSKTKVEIIASWSEEKDTELTVHMKADY